MNALWIGSRLGPMANACLRSFVRHGHRVVLHVYEKPEDAPPDVELADASRIMAKDRIVRHRASGSFALASDIFRYELQGAGAGVWIDCDCYCVRPLEDADYIYGWESDSTIAVGVLKIPQSSPLLDDLIRMVRTSGFIPPWLDKKKRRRYALRKALGFPKKIEDMPWATIGPRALTYFATQRGLHHLAYPQDAFYSLPFSHIRMLYDPCVQIRQYIHTRTRIIHLWNEGIRHIPITPPIGSPLYHILNDSNPLDIAA